MAQTEGEGNYYPSPLLIIQPPSRKASDNSGQSLNRYNHMLRMMLHACQYLTLNFQ